MSPAPDSFHQWLTEQINDIFSSSGHTSPFIVWCDPHRVWKDLLSAVQEDTEIELWADEVPELQLRERFHTEFQDTKRRIIWLPRARSDITYFKVFEIRADRVWEHSLEDALLDYGVTSAKIHELGDSLTAFTRTQLEKPLSTWLNVTDRDTCDNNCILGMLSGNSEAIADLNDPERFGIFCRRILQEFGLPEPSMGKDDEWRLQALAVLLCSDTVKKSPLDPGLDTSFIISNDLQLEKALGLLHELMRRIDCIPSFERLAMEAEKRTQLRFWASGIPLTEQTYASRTIELALFNKELKTIQPLKNDSELVDYLAGKIRIYKSHQMGFWGSTAQNKIRWDQLIEMAEIAQKLVAQTSCSTRWRSVKDAISWFTEKGWEIDSAGEVLFADGHEMPAELLKVRTRLGSAYHRHLDSTNQAFSELIAKAGYPVNLGPYAGEIIERSMDQETVKSPIAVIYLDALRYDLGERLAGMLNAGEPAKRATVVPARAPLPSITALGMTYALPINPQDIEVKIERDSFTITTSGFTGNLSILSRRRDFLTTHFKLRETKTKHFTTIKEILTASPDDINTKDLGKILFVFGDQLDKEGHDDELQFSGAEEILERYVRVVKLLQRGGYPTILITTDHGFFHWEPKKDEFINKPEGELLWKCRRSIVGYNLTHDTALQIPVSGSDLECMIPRSVNVFETYGGIGYFHGGATLQELIIPVITVSYPKKSKKIGAVIKPVDQITTLEQRIEVAPAGSVQKSLDGSVDSTLLSRNVIAKIIHDDTGELVFTSQHPATITPGGSPQPITIKKEKSAQAPYDSKLTLWIYDEETGEPLDHTSVVLKVELDEWF
jgi:hypothetical protein